MQRPSTYLTALATAVLAAVLATASCGAGSTAAGPGLVVPAAVVRVVRCVVPGAAARVRVPGPACLAGRQAVARPVARAAAGSSARL